jgi:hypothetical protein
MEAGMPLKRGRPEIVITSEGIEFLMQEETTEVLCRAERDLLRDKFGSRDGEGDERTFRLNRESIEEVASDKYDVGNVESRSPWKVIVSAADMASPLSRKM